MNNSDFWASIHAIIDEGFSPEGLATLDRYAEQFIDGRLVYKRFSPLEQHGCSEGGASHVVASLLAGAEDSADTDAGTVSDFKGEFQQGESHPFPGYKLKKKHILTLAGGVGSPPKSLPRPLR